MNPLEKLADLLRKNFPNITILNNGFWFDICLNDHVVLVGYHEKHGFGISCQKEYFYGEKGYEEVYQSEKEAYDRVFDLLINKKYTIAPYVV